MAAVTPIEVSQSQADRSETWHHTAKASIEVDVENARRRTDASTVLVLVNRISKLLAFVERT